MSYETDAPDDFKYSTKYLVTTADADMGASGMLRLETHLEAQDLRHLNYGSSAAKQVTLSFWVKSNKTGSYSAGLYMDSVASGSDNEISQAYTISSADTWEYKTLAFAANTTTVMNATGNDHGLRVWFYSAAGSNTTSGSSNTWGGPANRAVGQSVNLYDTVNNYWQITGVQLEVGSVATEFEHRSFGEELALCQRYFETSYDDGVGTNSDGKCTGTSLDNSSLDTIEGQRFMVAKRISPTVNILAIQEIDGSGSFSVGSVDHINSLGFLRVRSSGTTTGVTYRYHYNADAEL
jgi:hypothetical protein